MASEIIRIQGDAVAAEVVPARGGIASRLTIRGEEVFYLDPATLETAKVRGGNPVLFPNPGPLKDGTYTVEGKPYQLQQHGFAREVPWQVAKLDKNAVELRLASDEATKAKFPFDFDVRLLYKCSGNTFTVEQTWNNLGDKPMPLHFGFHPYFVVKDADKKDIKVSTDATKIWDNVTKTYGDYKGFDATVKELDLHLLDHKPKETVLERPGYHKLRISWDEPYSLVVLWTQGGKDFICVEPWTAPGNALNTGDHLVHVGPKERRKSFVAYTLLD